MPTLQDALFYTRNHKAIFPCNWITEEGKCSCGKENCVSPGKHPLWDRTDLQSGHKSASRDEEQIKIWWTRWPQANIGMPTGTINRLVALDPDVKDGKEGMQSLKATLNGTKMHDTLCARTGSGGMHVFFEIGPNDVIPRVIGWRKDMDLLGENGYALVAPSNHVSGGTYEWETKKKPLPLPDYLRKIMLSKENTSNPVDRVTEEDWQQTVYRGNPSRNKYITRLAGSLFRSNMPPGDVYSVCLDHNRKQCIPPLRSSEIKTIVKSCFRMERERRARVQTQTETKAEETLPPSERVFDYGGFNDFMLDYGGLDIPWVIQDWLPQASLGFLLSPPEGWKTWMLMDMALAIAIPERKFLGHYEVHDNGPVLFVQQEDSHPMLAQRWAKVMGVGPVEQTGRKSWRVPLPIENVPIHIHRTRQLTFTNKQSMRELDLAIREIKPKIVCIDPLYPLLSMQDYGAATAQEMMLFKQMRDVYGVSFLIAHHMKKGENTGRARDKGWGSQFLNAWIEMGIELTPSNTIPGKVLVERHAKTGARPPLLDLQFNVGEFQYDIDVVEAKAITATNEEKIKEALRLQAIGSYRELMDATGIKSTKIINAVMKKIGAIKLDDRYVLSEDVMVPRLVKGGLLDEAEEPV